MAPSTKLALANALKVQLQKKFLDDITVKELVEACEINRQTFCCAGSWSTRRGRPWAGRRTGRRPCWTPSATSGTTTW